MGKYVNETLTGNERVLAEATLHWSIFLSLEAILTLFIASWLRRASTEYAVTNKRLVWKVGLLSRKTGELNLKKIEAVSIEQSFLDRLLGCGTIVVVGSGGSRERFSSIATPTEFRKAIQEALEVAG